LGFVCFAPFVVNKYARSGLGVGVLPISALLRSGGDSGCVGRLLMKPTLSSLVLCVALVGAVENSVVAAPQVTETVVGPANEGGLFVISQDGAHVAYVGLKGTRTVVSVDGVAGPVLEELFNGYIGSPGAQLLLHDANAGGKFNGKPTAVIFSESGGHFAYIGRQGNEYVVIHDGKEVGRGARNDLTLQNLPLGISPKGKYVFWGEQKQVDGRGQWRLFVNGQPGPWAGHQDIKPVFSPDEDHYAYNAGTIADYQKQLLVVDGKVAGYGGVQPQYTADGKLLLTLKADGGDVVLVNGKPAVAVNKPIIKIVPGTTGAHYAVIVRKGTVNYEPVGELYLDGKAVAGTDGAMDISFSPDGKHYALRCSNPEAHSFFYVIDGKKGGEYQNVAEKVSWSPDSTKAVYQITASGRNFVVVNTEEFPVQSVGSLTRDPIVFPVAGGRYAFSSGDNGTRQYLTIVDGKNVLPANLSPNGDTFDFSADGSHWAMVTMPAGRNDFAGLLVDGTLDQNLAIGSFTGGSWITPTRNPYFLWSPDGKVLARVARHADNSAAGLYLNNSLVFPSTLGVGRPGFSPDSSHFYWQAAVKYPDRGPPYYHVYADGTSVAKLSGDPFLGNKRAWVIDSDGGLTFVGVDGNSVKRYHVTPESGMTIEKLIADATAAQAKLAEEAAAAKAKAAEDKAAADAKAKADATAAAEKRKADQAAAAAAKHQAQVDAANAKKLKQLNAQRAKKGLPPLDSLPDAQ